MSNDEDLRGPDAFGPTAGPKAGGQPSAIEALRNAAGQAGLDPATDLWNEALELAQEGHYGEAQRRLNVLLGLTPNDGDAHLLLAKILVAGQQWRRALASLDDAAAAGATVPDDLRQVVLRNLGGDEAGTEPSISREARENAELSKLRAEIKQLRSEAASLRGAKDRAEREATWWSYGTIAFAASVLVFVVWQVATAPTAATVAAATAPEAAATAGTVTDASGAAQVSEDPNSPRTGGLAEQAGQALMAAGILDGAELKVSVRGSSAQLSGTAVDFVQLRKAAEVVSKVPGITEVGREGVVVLSKRDGTTHEVGPGDLLGTLAVRYYGASTKADVILQANKATLGEKGILRPGQKLVIPPLKD